MNINFKERPTRHLVKANADGILTVNKKVYGPYTTIEALVAALGSDDRPEGWPIKLNRTVDRLTGKTVKSTALPSSAGVRRPSVTSLGSDGDDDVEAESQQEPPQPPPEPEIDIQPELEPEVEPEPQVEDEEPEPEPEPESEEEAPMELEPTESVHAWYHGETVRITMNQSADRRSLTELVLQKGEEIDLKKMKNAKGEYRGGKFFISGAESHSTDSPAWFVPFNDNI